MKNIKLFLLFSCFLSINAFSSPPLHAYLSYSTFFNPEQGPYIETYLLFNSKSCTFKKEEDGKFHANISAIIVFKEDTVIRNAKKYFVSTPVLDDTLNLTDNFIDIQRFSLPGGNYKLEVSLFDNNINANPVKSNINITINSNDKSLYFSDIQLVNSFSATKEKNVLSKNGYDIVPHVLSFYPTSEKKIIFYSEIYNASDIIKPDKNLFFKYYIQSYDNKEPLNSFAKMKKVQPQKVNVLLSEIDITDLPTGNYNLVIEARDFENKILTSNTMFFQRLNTLSEFKHIDISSIDIDNTFVGKITNEEWLNEFIAALSPISSGVDNEYVNNQILKSDFQTKKKYFYNFWLDRNHENPEQAWLDYYEKLKEADKSYKCTHKKGYETDRGRIFLQYGPPNTIYTNENEPSAYPYEIWHYYSIKTQTNAKFIFYLRDLVSNCYVLLNSNVIGEIQNSHWQMILYGRDTYPESLDETQPTNHWGRKAEEYYNNPH